MKFEIIQLPTNVVVAVYMVGDIAMSSFPNWKDKSQLEIPLVDMETELRKTGIGDIDSTYTKVDFYLPQFIKDKAFAKIAHHDGETDLHGNGEIDEEKYERIQSPPLKLLDILHAAILEISQNHQPNERFKVNIRDE